MAQNIVKFLVRRGSDPDRLQTLLQNGELAYVNEPGYQRLFVGDGVTYGGAPVGSRFFLIRDWTDATTLNRTQFNDLVYVMSTQMFWTLSGTGASPVSGNYQPLP